MGFQFHFISLLRQIAQTSFSQHSIHYSPSSSQDHSLILDFNVIAYYKYYHSTIPHHKLAASVRQCCAEVAGSDTKQPLLDTVQTRSRPTGLSCVFLHRQPNISLTQKPFHIPALLSFMCLIFTLWVATS